MPERGNRGTARRLPTGHPHQQDPCCQMTPFFDQQATKEYQNNTPQRKYDSNLRDAHCPLEPRHCLLLEGFLFEIMSEIHPNLLMMLWVEGARLRTELRGSAVIQTYCV